MCARAERGFTLLEVLVALAIVAIAFAAGSKAVLAGIDGAAALRSRTVALWVAENRLAELTVAAALPPVGSSSGTVRQGDSEFVWEQEVSATPNYSFRRVDLRVFTPGSRHALARLTGYVSNVPR
ncbi:type II secretion system minor pseudopilin GspI [Chitinilyticum litopenaei]|uniref:type II secretion system minor pseudopilin GspI n=1 Tax=Chitinilyticum litopenaei TaxID=1121276 RepID=UPI0003F68E34|nr:type II secretion system minor pseudopilin GspI [Chitinilyticum litopenaei]